MDISGRNRAHPEGRLGQGPGCLSAGQDYGVRIRRQSPIREGEPGRTAWVMSGGDIASFPPCRGA